MYLSESRGILRRKVFKNPGTGHAEPIQEDEGNTKSSR